MASVGIVGAGSIGLLLATLISQTQEVSLYVRRDEQKGLLENKGVLIKDVMSAKAPLLIKETSSPWEEELMIITVKQPALPALLKDHRIPTHPEQAILFIQNGMGHLQVLESLSFPHIFVGIIEHGVRKLNETMVDWKGKGGVKLGVIKGEASRIAFLTHIPFLNAKLENQWHAILQDKLLVNAVINPLTAIYRVPNGRLFQNPFFYKLAYSLFQEVVDILELPVSIHDEKWAYIKRVGTTTSENRSSMLQDVEAGRVTEVEAILGYLLHKRGKALDEKTPLLTFYYESIKGLDEEHSRRSI